MKTLKIYMFEKPENLPNIVFTENPITKNPCNTISLDAAYILIDNEYKVSTQATKTNGHIFMGILIISLFILIVIYSN